MFTGWTAPAPIHRLSYILVNILSLLFNCSNSMEEGSNHPDERNNVEGSKNPEGSYSPEGSESPEGPTTNPECPVENPESSENQEGSEKPEVSNNIEGSKTPEGSEKPEDSKNIEGSKTPEPEGSEKPEGFENLPRSKTQEENLEGSGNLLGSKNQKVKFIYSEKATKFWEISTNYLTGST